MAIAALIQIVGQNFAIVLVTSVRIAILKQKAIIEERSYISIVYIVDRI
jgi:hypothetical protein